MTASKYDEIRKVNNHWQLDKERAIKEKTATSPKKELRKQAEAKLSKQKEKTQPLNQVDVARLVHDLRVHQIELEMQNEELARLHSEAEATLSLYAELYAFAPVGYFTLTRDGTIRRANLTGAKMLGAGLNELIKRRFGVFVAPLSRTTFSDFLDRLFISGDKETCEVLLQREAAAVFWARIEAVSDSAHEQAEMCYAIVSDITERKKAEEGIQQRNAILEQRLKECARKLRAAQEKIARQDKPGVVDHANREQADLEMGTKPEDVLTEIPRLQTIELGKK
ncbi:MAG: PAS domain-containing protein [Anaerolineales bacterium]|nr:PAS domain-containing protein [Anaerolineales bacterium]